MGTEIDGSVARVWIEESIGIINKAIEIGKWYN